MFCTDESILLFILSFILLCYLYMVVWLFYKDLTWDRNYWKKRGVSGPASRISSISGSKFYGSFDPEINLVYGIDELYR